jgi:hypothetical protein
MNFCNECEYNSSGGLYCKIPRSETLDSLSPDAFIDKKDQTYTSCYMIRKECRETCPDYKKASWFYRVFKPFIG